MSDNSHSENNKTPSVLLQLEADARHSEDLLSLQYFIVNETRRLLRYRHAVLFRAGGKKDSPFHAIKVSGVTLVDRSIPKIHYIERIVAELKTLHADEQPIKVIFEQLPDELQQDRHNLSLPFPVWVELRLPDGFLIGALWLERETAWNDDELFLIKRLADTMRMLGVILTSTGNSNHGFCHVKLHGPRGFCWLPYSCYLFSILLWGR